VFPLTNMVWDPANSLQSVSKYIIEVLMKKRDFEIIIYL
jgi:hypothetical protein